MKFYINKMAKDTFRLTFVSLILQGLGIFLNSLISSKLGTASVGIMTLIFTLFGFIMVLANGNIFISTSRLVSEETGFGNRNYTVIMRYSVGFSLALSCFFMIVSFIFAEKISELSGGKIDLSAPIRIIALSLPFAAVGSCIKGYFNAVRKVNISCLGDMIEFAAKWIFLLISVIFLIDKGFDIYILIAASILIGEFVSFIFYLIKYISERKVFSAVQCIKPKLDTFRKYLKLSLPILASGYVQMILSTANDVLVPIALVRFNESADRAMSEYGMFEAMIIPTVFFPSVILNALSNVLMPEIARANSSHNKERVKSLVSKALTSSFIYSFFIGGLFLCVGRSIGDVICSSDSLVGETLVKMFPVIPFIYLEIVLECILKGLGKQNFSTFNSLCEYVIRIICVVVFVHFYGFAGVLISYYASNIYSNIVRIAVVCKATGIRFSLKYFMLVPFIYSASSCIIASAVTKLTAPVNPLLESVIFICTASIAFIVFYETGKLFSKNSMGFISIVSKA
ncbi:MAG: polysaccharide biosynthesis C-terminal domain-containing protein [Oscillospiraceae bacterium]